MQVNKSMKSWSVAVSDGSLVAVVGGNCLFLTVLGIDSLFFFPLSNFNLVLLFYLFPIPSLRPVQ